MKLTIPQAVSYRSEHDVTRGPVQVDFDLVTGEVRYQGVLYGVVAQGSYSYAPKAAGHGGKVIRFSAEVGEWQAFNPEDLAKPSHERYGYRGGVFPSHYRKNTRQAAIAALLTGDSYFTWARR